MEIKTALIKLYDAITKHYNIKEIDDGTFTHIAKAQISEDHFGILSNIRATIAVRATSKFCHKMLIEKSKIISTEEALQELKSMNFIDFFHFVSEHNQEEILTRIEEVTNEYL